MRRKLSSESGSSLIEVLFALGVLAIGALGTAGVFTEGMKRATSSPGDLTATQKAAEAVESVFSARDSHKLTWDQIRNVVGGSGNDNGVFLDGDRPMRLAGRDGLVNTADDGSVESVTLPGRDQLMGTADDTVQRLEGYYREVKIRDIQTGLRSITVTVTYRVSGVDRKYTLTAFISNYA